MKRFTKFAATALALGLIIPQAAPKLTYAEVMNTDTNTDVVKLRILETTDLHSNMMNYDYYQDKEVANFGFAKTATLIKQAKNEAKNSLLFDNGDLIQGSPLGDYMAKVNKLQNGETHPVYKAMNQLGYDAGNFGNHEFNYGLDYLKKAVEGSEFPYTNANVYVDDHDQDETNDKNFFDNPYLLLDREVVDEDGQKHMIKVGVIGFVPPQITQWDAARIGGQVVAKDIVKTAEKYVPEMKAKGADIIVAIPHSGIDVNANGENEENAVYNLSKVPGINAILFGHSHATFPSAKYASVPGADITKGTLNGVPTVQAGMWGDNLGLIDLTIEKQDGKWAVTDSKSSTRVIFVKENGVNKSIVDTDQGVVNSIKAEHEATIEYMKGALGETTAPINSYFSQVKDNESMQVVNAAQKWYVKNAIQGTTYENLPVLSAAAPFKAGTRDNPNYYTDIAKGTLQLKNAADLYLYDNNTVYGIVVTGAQVKEWLEMASGQFNQIKTDTQEEQNLVNGDYRSYNFDVIDGVTYEVDVTQPAKYDINGKVVNADANRIVNLQFDGKPIDLDQKFVVATNDYRGTSKYPGVPGSEVIVKSPESSREVVANYTLEVGKINPTPDMNWSFKTIDKDLNVFFLSSPEGQKYIKPTDNYKYVSLDATGFAKYAIDMKVKAQKEQPKPESKFEDVSKSHWAHDFIAELTEAGIVKGKSSAKFDPNGQLTRGQFVSMLVRALKLEAGKEQPFKDVKGELATEVSAAFAAGITTGKTADKFDPNAEITREQMAAMLVRAYNIKTGNTFEATTTATFTDSSKVSSFAKEYVNSANELGLMVGMNGKFDPKNKATRAQAAKVVSLLLKK
ncbi:MAG TPA: bifunctional 2',3'-cyclic-nucleotide 2'-phosphodiesterase/3'-nucleotidase, partial [Pseudoneobacillus sp.]|nr:bifunctional 2',3'-cyclic-nucleotide 2'-phosphodiesterase/3'-nucleotidase [Pseudoneobacillus sp.]